MHSNDESFFLFLPAKIILISIVTHLNSEYYCDVTRYRSEGITKSH